MNSIDEAKRKIESAKRRIELANAEWDRANAQCRLLIDMMARLDVEHPRYRQLLDELGATQEIRREEATRREIAMTDWFGAMLAQQNNDGITNVGVGAI